MSFLRSRVLLNSSAAFRRTIANTSQQSASVADPNPASSSSLKSSSSSSNAEDLPPLRSSIYGSRELIEAKRERKFAQYEKVLAEKAKREGLRSVSELRDKQEQIKAAKAKAKRGFLTKTNVAAASGMTESDAKVAAEIRRRVEAEAERKIKSGNFSSGLGIKSLSDILDLERIESDSPAKISQLWTQYHTLKNKISAVIPTNQYAEMISKARQYPNFLLPLPRKIVGSLENENETAHIAPGEEKQGYEMQYLQWSFLPPSQSNVSIDDKSTQQLSQEDKILIEKAVPTTVLFTPLAEYKLRQEYAQPVLILTHYTDLAKSKGIVLLRGEISGAEGATAGIAAAAIASQTGQASAEKIEILKRPLQSQGKLLPQDAQLLTVTLQRFYMPKATNVDYSKIPGEKERQELLYAFHNDQENFDIDKLCTFSLLT